VLSLFLHGLRGQAFGFWNAARTDAGRSRVSIFKQPCSNVGLSASPLYRWKKKQHSVDKLSTFALEFASRA
jgi:hypothetical protein